MEGEKTQLIDKDDPEDKTETNYTEETVETATDDFDPDKNGAGPIKDRSCTDILCLALLMSFVILWFMIACWGLQNGDPSKLMYPTNSFGEICGQGSQKDKPFLLFFDLTKCISLSALTGCPTPQVLPSLSKSLVKYVAAGLCEGMPLRQLQSMDASTAACSRGSFCSWRSFCEGSDEAILH